MYYSSLIKCLKHRTVLVLPGVGELCLKSSEATIDTNKNYVTSSETVLALKKMSGTDLAGQNDFLAKEWLCEPIKAHAVIQKITSAIISSCANKKSFDLAGLGEFHVQDGKIEFASSGELEKSYNYFSRPFPIIQAFVPRKTELDNSSEEVVKTVALDANSRLEEAPRNSNSAMYVKMVAASLIFALIALVGINYHKINENFLVPVKYDLESVDYNQDEINRSPETDGSETNIDFVLEEDQLKEDESADSSDPTIIEESGEINISTSSVQNSGTETSSSEQCIYILGSFSKAKNTQKMMSKIKSMDLTVYQAPFNGNTRIGVVIDCSDIDALHNIQSLQENPWLLK